MIQKRKNYKDGDRSTRDVILEIAEKEIALRGVEGLRLKLIAEQVGIQLPSLYAHFAGRKELLEALADILMDELLVIYDSLKGLPAREALLASADRTIDFYLSKRGYARLLLADFPTPYEFSVFNTCSEKICRVLQTLDETIARGVEENTVRPMPASLFLSFRMGVTLFPLFMRSDTGHKEMVTDPNVINMIKHESYRLLACFIRPAQS